MAVTVYLSPLTTIFQYLTDTGVVLAGGKVNTYQAGTSMAQATYTDSTGVTANANPIILGSNGRLPNVEIWQPIGVKIKAIITDANNNTIGPTLDQLAGIGDPTGISGAVFYTSNDSGAANAYILTVANAGFSSYTNGIVIYWIPANSNTGASTVNVNGLGTINITNADGSALVGGQIIGSQLAVIVSQGGNFILESLATLSGSFTPTWTGFSAAPTGTMFWQKTVNLMTLEWTGGQGTSNATGMTIGNLPHICLQASVDSTYINPVVCGLVDNTANAVGTVQTAGSSTLSFAKGTAPPSITGFTNSGTKGLPTGWSVSYLLK